MKIDMSGDEIKIYDFTSREALRIAIRLEEQGVLFYEALVNSAEDEEHKRTMEFLARDEKEHKARFQGMLDALGEDPEDEDTDISELVEVTDSGVFTPMKDLASLATDRKKALMVGIQAEKRSISFYGAVLDNTDDPEGRETITWIIGQEKGHLEKLNNLLKWTVP